MRFPLCRQIGRQLGAPGRKHAPDPARFLERGPKRPPTQHRFGSPAGPVRVTAGEAFGTLLIVELQVGGAADECQVCQGLREVAKEGLLGGVDLLREEADIVGPTSAAPWQSPIAA